MEIDSDMINIAKITDGLFLGDKFAGTTVDIIFEFKISHMINTCSNQIPSQFSSIGIKYLTFNWPEIPSSLIIKDELAIKILKFIDNALKNGDGIMIYSLKGKNRVCVAVIIYLMKKYFWSLEKCLDYLHSKKPDMQISNNFLQQLFNYETQLIRLNPKKNISNDWTDLVIKDNVEIVMRNTYINEVELSKKKCFIDNKKKSEIRHVGWVDEKNNGGVFINFEIEKDLFLKKNVEDINVHLGNHVLKSCVKKSCIEKKEIVNNNFDKKESEKEKEKDENDKNNKDKIDNDNIEDDDGITIVNNLQMNEKEKDDDKKILIPKNSIETEKIQNKENTIENKEKKGNSPKIKINIKNRPLNQQPNIKQPQNKINIKCKDNLENITNNLIISNFKGREFNINFNKNLNPNKNDDNKKRYNNFINPPNSTKDNYSIFLNKNKSYSQKNKNNKNNNGTIKNNQINNIIPYNNFNNHTSNFLIPNLMSKNPLTSNNPHHRKLFIKFNNDNNSNYFTHEINFISGINGNSNRQLNNIDFNLIKKVNSPTLNNYNKSNINNYNPNKPIKLLNVPFYNNNSSTPVTKIKNFSGVQRPSTAPQKYKISKKNTNTNKVGFSSYTNGFGGYNKRLPSPMINERKFSNTQKLKYQKFRLASPNNNIFSFKSGKKNM